ncbi:hypothetical protein CDL12_07676 [Handroanthus impetiginosus]|uniref:BZIP domain-containing protein n=1 Tax=Handroanthus impetiginosus TaxID=429701 RepID=A0A2G9HQT2_9LAMI|nr:hypothetical protein CDL12_07676 [Handroanthus impetiginosus]
MAGTTVVSDDPPPLSTADYDFGLSVPPLDTAFFSQHFLDNDGALGDNQDDVVIDDLDFGFSFDDLDLPSAEELDDLLNPRHIFECDTQPRQDANFPQLAPNLDQLHGVFKSASSELRHISREGDFAGDSSSSGSGVLTSVSPGLESHQVSGYLNVPSPESNGGISGNCCGDAKLLNCPSPESRGSGNCGSNVSEDSTDGVTRSVSSSPNLNNRAIRTEVINERIKLEKPPQDSANGSLFKRKKDCEGLPSDTVESRINKCRKSCSDSENNNNNNINGGLSEGEERRKARLMRNRESAQLSRQRKKHYVEELEDKVKRMHSTIQDLNAKISYFMADNAALRQQMGGSATVPPPPMVPPPPGTYPHPAFMYPWMPCAPSYMMKPQGSQVPLVPIPRLKPQQPAPASKATKKVESKKNERPKTKKVASVSFLGLLFFIFLFGCLVPMINLKYGGVRETLTGGESYTGGEFYEKHRGKVLLVNGTDYGKNYGDRRDFIGKSSVHCGQRGHDSGGKPNADEFVLLSNGSEPLVASLYVPRNDKLVKIDGNLIIHSVLASEKAMSSHGKKGGETSLAVPGELRPYIPVPGMQSNGVLHPHLRALGSGSADRDSRKPKATDGRLQQWFREGLAASASGAIVSAATRNISEEQNQNSTHVSKGRNRRILHGLPVRLPKSSHNISRQDTGKTPQKGNLNGNKSSAPMVVSVLVDPREVGDADIDGVMGRKALSRIFVVVLVDSVKYVTYSCMLPFKGSATHLVTT